MYRVNIGLGDGLAPIRWQAITWINADRNIVNWTPRNKLQWNSYRNSIVCEMLSTPTRPQCVYTQEIYFIHNKCYKTYVTARNIARVQHDTDKHTSGLRSQNIPYEYEIHCLICATELKFESTKKYRRGKYDISNIELITRDGKSVNTKHSLDCMPITTWYSSCWGEDADAICRWYTNNRSRRNTTENTCGDFW